MDFTHLETVTFTAFEADLNSGIVPTKQEGRVAEKHIPPKLVKSGSGWKTRSSLHWFSDEKPIAWMLPPNLRGDIIVKTIVMAALIAVTYDGVTMPPPGGILEGSLDMGLSGLFFNFIPRESDEGRMNVVTPRGRVHKHCQENGLASQPEVKPLAPSTFDYIAQCMGKSDVFTAEISTRESRDAVQLAFPDAIVLQGKRNKFTLVFGMSVAEYCDLLDTEITQKLGLKYMGGLFARIGQAGHSTPQIEIIDLPYGGDGDGILRYSDASQLAELDIKNISEEITNVRAKIWHAQHGLIKGLFVLVKDESVDCLTFETNMSHNCKGCLQGVAKSLNVDCIVHAWAYEAKRKGKAANTSPMMLGQLGQASYDACIFAAEMSLEEDAHRLIDAIIHGVMDDAMLEGQGKETGNEIIARDELRILCAKAGLPTATFGSLLRYLKPLIENWKGDLASLEKACLQRAINFRKPHSNITTVLSEGTFRRICQLTKGHDDFVPFAERGLIKLYSEELRMTVVCEKYHEAAEWDAGDNDGDTQVDADIKTDGNDESLTHRWPAGAKDFDKLDPQAVDVPLHNKEARRLDGSIVKLEPLEFNNETDCIDLVDVTVHEDEHMPKGKLTPENFEEWQEVLGNNIDAALPIGTYALLQTALVSHDKEATLPKCEFVVDGDIQGTSCVATSQEVDEAIEPAMNAFSEGEAVDPGMFLWARMGLNGYTLDPEEAGKKVLLRGVEGSFTRLAKAMVTKRNECAAWLKAKYQEVLKGGQRNSAPIIAAAEAAGLVADLDKGRKGVEYVNAGNSLALLRRLDEMDPRAAAEAVYSMYVYIDSQPGMFDSALFHAPKHYPGTKYQTVAAYLVAWLAEGPNPEGDGPSTETTETQTETAETAEMDEHTQFEVLDAMNMKQLIQHCKDNGVKGWSKYRTLAKKGDLIRLIIDNTDDDDDNNPTPPNGGGDNPKKGNDMSQDENWSVVEQICREAREKAEKLSVEQLRDFIQQRKKDLSETGFKAAMNCSSKEELVQFVVDGCLHVWDTEDIPAPPNGGGEGEAASRILEAMMPQIEAERAELAAQKKKEDNMSKKKKTVLVKKWTENGKAVQLKKSADGKHFFVVDGDMKWIPQNLLSEEDSKDIGKVRALYGEAKREGAEHPLFKSLTIAGLLFAALLGMETEGLMAMAYNVVVWNQEKDGLHPWIQWKQWMNNRRVDLLAQYRKAEKSIKDLHEELDNLNLVIANGEASQKQKDRKELVEEMIWHYEDQAGYLKDEIESGEANEPKDRPLVKNNNKSSLCNQACGTFRIKSSRGKNNGQGYYTTHVGCRPDQPCQRAHGGSIAQPHESVIVRGQRVTLWYTGVKMSQVKSCCGNPVRRDV